MPYYRLIKETDTEIHLSTEGMEIPGTECVHASYSGAVPSSKIVTFENGLQILCHPGQSFFLPVEDPSFILHKIYDKDVKKCKNTYKTLSQNYITTTTQPSKISTTSTSTTPPHS